MGLVPEQRIFGGIWSRSVGGCERLRRLSDLFEHVARGTHLVRDVVIEMTRIVVCLQIGMVRRRLLVQR